MKSIAIITNEKKDHDYTFTKEVVNFLLQNDRICYLEKNVLKQIGMYDNELSLQTVKYCDFILVIGGDGTMLHAIFEYGAFNLPFIGINIGRIGFLADLSTEGYQACFKNIFEGDYIIDTRSTVCVRGKDKIYGYALNEIMFRHRQGSGVGTFRLSIDQTLLSNYVGDGVLICAPTGSTAYAFSAGGPIVNPNCDIMMIQPLAPHSLNNRSVIISSNETVSVDWDPIESIVYIDGMSIDVSERRLVVEKGTQNVKFIRTKQYNFYNLLFNKLIQENQQRGV